MNSLDTAAVDRALRTSYVGRRLVYFISVKSTMDVARQEAVDRCEEGTVVLAEEQTAGRGRFGRKWVSPDGKNLYLTLVMRPPVEKLRSLSMAAPLAVALAIEEVSPLRATIKWPNDVRVNGRKVSGVLIENEVLRESVRWSLVGIGVNVNFRIDPESEIAPIATSIAQEAGGDVSREAVLAALLSAFEQLYEGDPDALREAWKARLETLGQAVRVTFGEQAYEGVAEDVDAEGNLLLRTADGELLTMEAGEVSLRA